MSGPPPRLGQEKRAELLKLIDQYTRIETGLRTGFFNIHTKPAGELSLANDMADIWDKIRVLLYDTDDYFVLAVKFGMGKKNK